MPLVTVKAPIVSAYQALYADMKTREYSDAEYAEAVAEIETTNVIGGASGTGTSPTTGTIGSPELITI